MKLSARALAALGLSFLAVAAQAETNFRIATNDNVSPHLEFLTYVAETIAPDHGISIEPVVINDVIQSHGAVISGEIDGNVQSNRLYVASIAEAREWDLVPTVALYDFPFAAFSLRHDSLDDLPQGGQVAIPNDPSNAAHALLLLAEAGVIEVSPEADPPLLSPADVTANPLDLTFVEVATPQVPRSLEDVDLAIAFGILFKNAEISEEDRVYTLVDPDDSYATQLILTAENAANPDFAALIETFQDPRAAAWIAEHTDPLYVHFGE